MKRNMDTYTRLRQAFGQHTIPQTAVVAEAKRRTQQSMEQKQPKKREVASKAPIHQPALRGKFGR